MLSVAWLAEQMRGEKETQPLLKVLNRCIPVGREAAEHCVLAAGFSPALKMSSAPWEDTERMASLVAELQQATLLFHATAAQVPPG